MPLYPLKFHPKFVAKDVWGGRRLETVLGKSLPPQKAIGESWEVYDFPPGVVDKTSPDWLSAPVANGPLAGKTLHELVEAYGQGLLGRVEPLAKGQFPLLIKFLDAKDVLSVQVHPDENYVRTHPGAHVKNEAWYVVQCEPGSVIYKGVVAGTTRERFRVAIENGTVMKHIVKIPVKAGQCYYLPSGTVHALGRGVLVAEVQTPSDTTFRVYDFDRLDENGKRRELHIEQALECIDFSGAPEPAQPRSHVAGMFTTVSRLVTAPQFVIEKVRFTEGVEEPVPYDEPVIWMMLEGEAQITVDGVKEATRFKAGETLLLPAGMKNPVIKTLTDCAWLEVTFPMSAESEV